MTGLIAGVRKIAVLRANGIGDFIFALPALDALRTAYPAAEISLLACPWHREFLTGRPGPVDRVIVVPPSHGVREDTESAASPRELNTFFDRMRAERFDLALQLHGGGANSNPFLLRLGARLTAGLRTPNAPALDRWVPYLFYQREVLRYLEVVALVGASPVGVDPALQVTHDDVAASLRVLPADTRPIVSLHPGASDPRRRWTVEQFAAAGDALANLGARVVVTGTLPERDLTRGVVATMRHEAIDLCDRLTLGGLAGLFSRCAVVISNDSGPLHLAGAVGAPTVGIYWALNMITAGPMTCARHRSLLSWRLTCPVCGVDHSRGMCDHEATLVGDVRVDDVVAAAASFVQTGAQPTMGSASRAAF